MKVKIIGKKVGSFTSKEGETINFGKLHCIGSFALDESGVDGDCCIILSCRPDVAKGIRVPCNADIDLNQYGRIAFIEVLED